MSLCENLLWYTVFGVQLHELARVVSIILMFVIVIQTVLAVFGVYANMRTFVVACVLLCGSAVTMSLTLDKYGVHQLKQQCASINYKP